MHQLKRVLVPHLNKTICLGGRRRPVAPSQTLKARHVLRGISIATPTSTNNHAAAATGLKQMDLNDTEGDCVIAGRSHRQAVLTANAGKEFVYTTAQVQAEYERIGGYVPGDPSTDQGCDMTVAANDGVTNGYADGSHDVGFITVDPTNKTEVMQILYLFEVGDFGFCIPDSGVNPFPSDGSTWNLTGAPDPDNGHCIQLVDYDETKGVLASTWGMLVWITWAALAEYGAASAGGELIVHLNADQIAKASAKAPNGLDWNKLITYFDEQPVDPVPQPSPTPAPPTPAPPAPSPAPSPSPSPTPPAPTPAWEPTLEGFIKAAESQLHSPLMTRAQAERAMRGGLTTYWTEKK